MLGHGLQQKPMRLLVMAIVAVLKLIVVKAGEGVGGGGGRRGREQCSYSSRIYCISKAIEIYSSSNSDFNRVSNSSVSKS